jgi:hypothetical protein
MRGDALRRPPETGIIRRCPMIELTAEQRRFVECDEETPPRVVDPVTQARYVLLREDVFHQLKTLVDTDDRAFAREMTSHVLEVFGRDGWDDPAMDVYNELDPRINP